MSLKKIAEFHNTADEKKASVYRDSEWQEYRVKFNASGIYLEGADYHTTDKIDAIDTASNFASSNTYGQQ